MPYITQTDLEKRWGANELQRITGDNPLDEGKIAEAIADAERDIDTFARDTEGYPWTTTPAQAVSVAAGLAYWYLYSRGRFKGAIPLSVRDDYNLLKAELLGLRKGEVSWISGITPAQQALSQVFISLPGDEPEHDDVREARYGKLRRIL